MCDNFIQHCLPIKWDEGKHQNLEENAPRVVQINWPTFNNQKNLLSTIVNPTFRFLSIFYRYSIAEFSVALRRSIKEENLLARAEKAGLQPKRFIKMEFSNDELQYYCIDVSHVVIGKV